MVRSIKSHLATGNYDRAVVLVGNYHALRKIQWAEKVLHKTPFMAEQLALSGIQVTNVLQKMDIPCDHQRQPHFSSLEDQEGLSVAYNLVQHLNIAPKMDVRAAIDAVVVWRCQK